MQRVATQKRGVRHGDASLRAQYSDETKAACLAALLAGQSVGEVAAAYSVPSATLRSWKSRLGPDGQGTAALVTEDGRAEIGDLLLIYLARVDWDVAEAVGRVRGSGVAQEAECR